MVVYAFFIVAKSSTSMYFSKHDDEVGHVTTDLMINVAATAASLGGFLADCAHCDGADLIECASQNFHLHRTATNLIFAFVTDPATLSVTNLYLEIYGLYSDYVLKNPFTTLDQPILNATFTELVNEAVNNFNNPPPAGKRPH
jgi:hypothetical protein